MPSTTEDTELEDMEIEVTGGRRRSMEVIQVGDQEGENGEGNDKDKNKRKQMAERSEIWQHFTKIKDDNDVVKKAKCKYCGRELRADSYQNGTSALKRHLNICKLNPNASTVVGNSGQTTSTTARVEGQHQVTWKYAVLRLLYANLDYLPYSLINSICISELIEEHGRTTACVS